MLRKDLSPYTHSLTGAEMPGMFNIGFIEEGDEFSLNSSYSLSNLCNKLRKLLLENKFRGNINRGQEPCKICSRVISDNDLDLGVSELWIPSGEIIYVSPDFIIHYIEKHGYVPPEKYAMAVFELDVNIEFNAEAINEELVFS